MAHEDLLPHVSRNIVVFTEVVDAMIALARESERDALMQSLLKDHRRMIIDQYTSLLMTVVLGPDAPTPTPQDDDL